MKEIVDNGEVELSDDVLLTNTDLSGDFQGVASVDSFLNDFLKNTRTCTHTHTCNPPGPDATHTHTCYHTHAQVIASEEDNRPNNKHHSGSKPRQRPSGNREAVRKYREKKKARTAYLEEEVRKLKILNQQLVKKLQGQAILEAEVLRLRSLFVTLRGKINKELGIFPFQKPCNTDGIIKDGDCGVLSPNVVIGINCQRDLPCFHSQPWLSSQDGVGGSGKTAVSWEQNCHPAIIDCLDNLNRISNGEGQSVDTIE